MYEPARDRQEAEQLRQYMSQVRQELAVRVTSKGLRGIESGDGKAEKVVAKLHKEEVHGQGTLRRRRLSLRCKMCEESTYR